MSPGILSAWNATWPEAKLWTAPPPPVETHHEDIDFFLRIRMAVEQKHGWVVEKEWALGVSLYYLPIYGDSAFMYRWIGWFECKSESLMRFISVFMTGYKLVRDFSHQQCVFFGLLWCGRKRFRCCLIIKPKLSKKMTTLFWADIN